MQAKDIKIHEQDVKLLDNVRIIEILEKKISECEREITEKQNEIK